ncbi:MAG TPA: hypothetical protein VGG61_06590 [Gemmataceae bacterium]
MPRSAKQGANDLAEVVNYITSHDVADFHAMRFMNYLFGGTLAFRGLGTSSIETVRDFCDNLDRQSDAVKAAHADALEWVRSGFVIDRNGRAAGR